MINKQQKIIDLFLQNRILYHILFWVIALLLYTLIDGLNTGFYRNTFIKYLALLPAQILATYSLTYYLTPNFLAKGKYFYFAVGFLISVYLFSAFGRWSMIYLAEPWIRSDFQQESWIEILSDPLYLVSVYFPGLYLIVFIFYALKNIKARFEERHQIAILQKEKTDSELQLLKTQIHPHFLFNTLNNLYALSIEQSPKVPDAILKLSDLLDYVLYQCSGASVPLEKEVAFIKNYIELESLRYGDKLDLCFNFELEESKHQVVPLVLLSLVENVFKHGVRGNKTPKVELSIKVEKQALHFKAYNNKPQAVSKASASLRKGIGSTNVKKQLDLLYPNQYDLQIEDLPESYSVSLKLPLL